MLSYTYFISYLAERLEKCKLAVLKGQKMYRQPAKLTTTQPLIRTTRWVNFATVESFLSLVKTAFIIWIM